jgi:endonuclease IV
MIAGPHVNRNLAKSGARPSIVEHIRVAVDGADHGSGFTVGAVAVFVGGPNDRRITLTAGEAAELRAFTRETGVRVYAHSSYTAQPWRGDPDAARYIREEQAACIAAGISGLVVHLPKLPREAVLKYAGRIENKDMMTYLEIPAVSPTESYYETPEKLGALFDCLPPCFGLCVDTAHLNTCGVDLGPREAAEAWLLGLEARVDPRRTLLHLNDSARPLGKGPDAHAALCKGTIWSGYRDRLPASGLAAVVDYARRHDVAAILERKPAEELVNDYAVLRELGEKGRIALQSS